MLSLSIKDLLKIQPPQPTAEGKGSEEFYCLVIISVTEWFQKL